MQCGGGTFLYTPLLPGHPQLENASQIKKNFQSDDMLSKSKQMLKCLSNDFEIQEQRNVIIFRHFQNKT